MPRSVALSRRTALSLAMGLAAAGSIRPAAAAVTTRAATALVERVAADIADLVNSGRGEAAMQRAFERVLMRYADMPTIARSVLGPPARAASAAQLRSFAAALQGYMGRKYGRRFREFTGGTITVTGARDTGRYVEVIGRVDWRGGSPVEVRFRVWDRGGDPRFIDLLIEGISLVISERNEIGALLDRNGGDIDATIADLRTFG